MSATNELRPCPMCGSTDIKVYTTESVQSYRRGTVKCEKCGCTVRAEGGGHELFRELGIEPYGKFDDHPIEDWITVRNESNKRARQRAIDKWNGVAE